MNKSNCPFCSSETLFRKFYENELSMGILARHAVSDGQALVLPKRHIERYSDLSNVEIEQLFDTISETNRILKTVFSVDGINIVLNDGIHAGQTVEHLHFHIIPRYKNDISIPKYWLSKELFGKLYEKTNKQLLYDMKIISKNYFLQDRQKEMTSKIVTENSYIAGSVIFHGNIKLGKNSIVEENVIIGHPPSSSKIADLIQANSNHCTLNENKYCVTIGENAIIRSGTIIYSGVNIGSNLDCGHNVLIRDNSRIGKNVYIYSNTQINCDVIIGNKSRIAGWIGNRSKIENNVSMFGHLVHKYNEQGPGRKEPAPIVRSNSMIGWNATIVGGVEIGENSIIGAGAIVTENVLPHSKIVGSPTRPI